MKYSTFSYNQSSSEYGGALANTSFLALAGSSLNGNSAPYGGAVYNQSTVSLSGDSLSSNRAQYGAGLYTGDLATISSTRFQQNSASTGGRRDLQRHLRRGQPDREPGHLQPRAPGRGGWHLQRG